MWCVTVLGGKYSWLIGRCWAACRTVFAGFIGCIEWTANGRAGIAESMVFRLRIAEMRRRPLLIFRYEDLLEDVEWMDEAAEVREVVANDEVFVRCCSLELSEGG